MISRATGEIHFEDLVDIRPLERLPFTLANHEPFRIPGWTSHDLEVHLSDHGAFRVFVVTDGERRVRIVFLCQHRPMFESYTVVETARRACHEKVIATDLAGQREFSWGKVFCRQELVVAYSGGLHVPIQDAPILELLFEHDGDPFESILETSAIAAIGPRGDREP